jgi:ribonuclease P protein component
MLAYVRHAGERTEVPVQMGFSVSKRRFKRAVDRNRVKRLMRETYRKRKTEFFEVSVRHQLPTDAMLIFIGREMPVYSDLERKISALLKRWDDTLLKHGENATHDSIQPPTPSAD